MAILNCHKPTNLSKFIYGKGGLITVKTAYSTLLKLQDGELKTQELIGSFTYKTISAGGSNLSQFGQVQKNEIAPNWTQSYIRAVTHYDENNSKQFEIAEVQIRGIDYLGSINDGAAISLIELLLSGDDSISGSNGDDVLLGYNGNDDMNGLGGKDYMAGGRGSDNYWIDSSGDIIEETEGDNFESDRAYSKIDYTLPMFVEELVLEDAAAKGTGNSQANKIVGNKNENILDGGAGKDIMAGGEGSDVYLVDNSDDAIVEQSPEEAGTQDRVYATCDYELPDNVEILYLTGDKDTSGTGNRADNKLYGNDRNNTLIGGKGIDMMSGGQGNDTYHVDEQGDIIVEEMDSGTDNVIATSSYSLPENIENITLQGENAIFAMGNNGDNILTGSTASNTLTGGRGNDTYYVGINDVVNEKNGEGEDTVHADASFTIPINVEKLILTGIQDLDIWGNSDNNQLIGNSGNNHIDGKAGADTMQGGDGDDTYYVDDKSDIIQELDNEGNDTVNSWLEFKLSMYTENLTLAGKSNIDGWGNHQDNTLKGNEGKNKLFGGKGNDEYYVGENDTVIEFENEGIDSVYSDIQYELPINLENLILTGTLNVNGIGNSLSNILKGNQGINTLLGGQGDDIYYVSQGDKVVEKEGEGTDSIFAPSTHMIDAFVENLTLIGKKNADAIGNDLDNNISGNEGVNILRGRKGNDTYNIDSNDTVIELENEGIDTVIINQTYILPLNVECIVLVGDQSIDAFGNDHENILTGNSADNLLDGGLGADRLIGGKGNDSYIVTEGDQIIEYETGGIDMVYSNISWTISEDIENLILIGAKNIDGIGNGLNNKIKGNKGINRLIGGSGDDTYIIEKDDLVIELKDEGYDTVISTGSYIADANIEKVCLVGSANADVDGNNDNNIIQGNKGINVCRGSRGNDTYIVGAQDRVIEYTDEGIDTIISNESIILPDFVENAILKGHINTSCQGNSGDNIIKGNYAKNALAGGSGNDTYYVDAKDTIIEYHNEGIDTIITDFSHALENNLEDLILKGSRHINGSGNSQNNNITGNKGKNCLVGGGGKDIITGGLGADIFRYEAISDSPLGNLQLEKYDELDIITDFKVIEGDRLDLQKIDSDETAEGNQEFIFIGDRQFSGLAGELRTSMLKGNCMISADTNGDKKPEFAVILQNVRHMYAHWIVL